jgi:hypothetical protein
METGTVQREAVVAFADDPHTTYSGTGRTFADAIGNAIASRNRFHADRTERQVVLANGWTFWTDTTLNEPVRHRSPNIRNLTGTAQAIATAWAGRVPYGMGYTPPSTT